MPDDSYERLRDLIYSGELMPNERLVEADLAQRLQVTRAIVRTALVRLGQDGIVVLTPHRGGRVRMVTDAEAVEILQARAALEALTAREAARHATAREITGLRRILAAMGKRLEEGDLLAYSDGNATLHAAIIEAARHETAARLISGLRAQLVRFQFRTILVPGRGPTSFAEHTAIVEAIATRNPDAAETAMRHHLSHVEATLSQANSQSRSPAPSRSAAASRSATPSPSSARSVSAAKSRSSAPSPSSARSVSAAKSRSSAPSPSSARSVSAAKSRSSARPPKEKDV